jgi:hypothetical protein
MSFMGCLSWIVVELFLMCTELEDQIGNVQNEHDDGVHPTKGDFFHGRYVGVYVVCGHLSGKTECGRKEGTCCSHEQHGDTDRSGGGPELLHLIPTTANPTRYSKDEEHIGEHGSEHGELDNTVETGSQGGYRNEQFGGVAEGCVEQRSDRAVGVFRDLFRDKRQSEANKEAKRRDGGNL